jgi:hypothetical protein
MIAFENFRKNQVEPSNENKLRLWLRLWLKDYEGLNFSIGENGQDKIYWAKEKSKYVYSDNRFNEPILCFDDTYRACCNKIQRKLNRLTIEIDEVRDIAQKKLLKIKDFLKNEGIGFIHSSHNSKNGSDYLWIEFTRDISDNEAQKFLKFLANKFQCVIDLNFASNNRRFPVLFATHWKYPKEKELPIDFFEGKAIDYDSLIIPDVRGNTKTKNVNGFKYKTFESERLEESKPLKFWTIADYKNFKPDKSWIIKDRVYPSQIEMTYAPSNSFKSLFMLYQAIIIAHGKKRFLDKFPVRKRNVGILSAENSKKTDKERIEKIMRGLKIRKKDIHLYILPRESCGDMLNSEFKRKVVDFVVEKDIRVLYLDTINPLTPEIDDNKAKDVTRVFNELLKTLSDMGVYVSFLHHTDKQGNSFLGSTKWKANCDSVFRVERKGLESQFKLFCEKSRDGESNVLDVRISFTEKAINFYLLAESEPTIFKKTGKIPKIEQQKAWILQNLTKPCDRKALIKILEEKNQLNSIPTFDRALKLLKDTKIKQIDEVYSLI